MNPLRFTTALSLVFALSGCPLTNIHNDIAKASADITAESNKINANAANIVETLRAIKDDYPDEIKTIINNDIDRLVKTTVQASSEEMRCDASYIARSTKAGLENLVIKIKNLGRPDSLLPLMAYPPTFCTCSPNYVDLNKGDKNRVIDISGYDFDNLNSMRVYATKLDGTKKEVVHKLNKTAEFHTALPINNWKSFEEFDHIEFYYNNINTYSIPIIPATPKVCDERDVPIAATPASYNFHAIAAGGDQEFGGDADIVCSGTLSISPDQRSIVCKLNYFASEVDGDTRASYDKNFNIYTSPDGTKIKSILSPTSFEYRYRDDDEEDDDFGGNGFVDKMILRGDHHGTDVGPYTGANMVFSVLRATLISEKDGCIPKDQYATVINTRKNDFVNKDQQDIVKSIKSKLKLDNPL
jgi:hypothetical protein